MNTTVNINDHIKVRIQPQPKKKKVDPKLYDIYLLFTVSENGVTQYTPAISTGITVGKSDWDVNKREMKGRNENAELKNNSLIDKINVAKLRLEAFKNNDVRTCTQVKDEILSNVKIRITGNSPRGMKQELKQTHSQATLDAVMVDLFRTKNQSKERRRIYGHALNILKGYFKNDPPLITAISEKDLREFQIWYKKNYRTQKGLPPTQDTTTTWFGMIAAIFHHAHARMKLIKECPVPEGFRGSFANNLRGTLSQSECLALINLEDSTLTPSEQIAKHCLIIQMLTGIGYGDLKSLTREHYKFKNDSQRWMLSKPRNKTCKIFRVYLTPRAKHSFDKLRELAGGNESLFKLPSIDYMNRVYKHLAKKADVETHVTTYTLRHTFAVDYMNADGRLEDLAEHLGNDVRTAKVYGRISNQRLADKTNQLEAKSVIHQLT